ncbi:hypothetical protein NMG60_11034982 [Bertholletia excelsa]
MAPENLRHRLKDEFDVATPTATAAATVSAADHNVGNIKDRRQRKIAMARRGLRTLGIAVAVPVTLNLLGILLLSSVHGAPTQTSPVLSPWMLRLIFVGSNFLMGLCGWLFWAEGGFHSKPVALALYLSYMVLSLAWDPIVFGQRAVRAGMLVSLVMFGSLLGCSRIFKEVNPIAGDLAKLCLIWAGLLVSLNLKLLYW